MSEPLNTSLTHRVLTGFVVAASVSLLGAAPAAAEHHARLSADLADHLAVGSSTINVIVHGDKATVDALRHLKSRESVAAMRGKTVQEL